MIISEGYFYHIKDEYFTTAGESTLMSNYENGGYRPHYFAVRDSSNFIQKYDGIIHNEEQKKHLHLQVQSIGLFLTSPNGYHQFSIHCLSYSVQCPYRRISHATFNLRKV